VSVILEAVPFGPGDNGKTGSSRSSAWIAVFSSMQNTTACCGGSRYKPITSAAFVSNSGSVDRMYRSSRWGCRPACCQARATIVCCTPSFRPSDRVDQCVAPCGGGRRVHVMMRAAKAGVRTVGFEPR